MILDYYKGTPVLDIDDMAKYFVKHAQCTLEQAYLYIEGEEEYMELQGLLMDEPDEMLESPENAMLTSSSGTIRYIVMSKQLPVELVTSLYDLEYEYLRIQGLAGSCF